MTQTILTRKGIFVIRQTLRKLKNPELVCESEKSKRNLFDDIFEKKLDSFMFYPEKPIPEGYILHEDEPKKAPQSFPDYSNPVQSDGTAAFENIITDHLIYAEVNLPEGKKIQGVKVIGRT